MKLALFLAAALTLPGPAHADRLSAALAVERARPPAPLIDRERFPEDRKIVSVSLSPDGKSVAFVRIMGEQRSLWLQSTAPNAAARRILPRVGTAQVEWSPDSRWLFLIDDKEIRLLSVVGQSGSGVIAPLGGGTEFKLLALDPWRTAALLVDHANDRWRLWRAAPGGAKRLLAFGRRQIVDVAIDRDGRLAFVKLAAGDHHLIAARQSDGKFGAVTTCVRMQRCDLLSVTPDGRAVYLASDLTGDRRGLVRLGTDGSRRLLHDDPAHEVDVDAIMLDPINGTPLIAQYRGTEQRLYGLNDAARTALSRLPRSSIQTVQPSSSLWLVREEDSRLQGSLWRLFDPRTGRQRLLLDDHADRLPIAELARGFAFDFPASDGMAIHAILTAPPGRDLAKAPLITLAHGGPWSHDEVGYSPLAQLLANRGYIVLQPQFRGSTGFGRAYMFAAHGDFGDGRVQRDIEDGTRYLLSRGIGDARRSAIMGASFGGYSTLQALSNGSNLYQTGIAIVPPTDLGWTIGRATDRTDLGDSEGIDFATTLKFLEMDPADPNARRRLEAQSPRAHLAAIKSPLLLIAAGRDERVPIRSVIDYAARLKAGGGPATVIVGGKLMHSNKDRLGLQASLFMIDSWFYDRWGGAEVARPSPLVRRWMADNLKTL